LTHGINIQNYFGGWWGRESSFYFVRYEQTEMCLTVRWIFFSLQVTGYNKTNMKIYSENSRDNLMFSIGGLISV